MAITAAALSLGAGCTSHDESPRPEPVELPAHVRPTPIGASSRYQLPRGTPRSLQGKDLGEGLACTAWTPRVGQAAHIEIFADGKVLLLPIGVGAVEPRTEGGRVVHADCLYPVTTLDPSGMVWIHPDRPSTLADLFRVWGQPLGRKQIAGFQASDGGLVKAFRAGQPVSGDPRDIALRPGDQVVLQVNSDVPPHPAYRFPPVMWDVAVGRVENRP